MQHTCIKCAAIYTDDEPDAYYCPACQRQNKAIADSIDKKLAKKGSRKGPSFEEKMQSFQTVKGITMINVPRNGQS